MSVGGADGTVLATERERDVRREARVAEREAVAGLEGERETRENRVERGAGGSLRLRGGRESNPQRDTTHPPSTALHPCSDVAPRRPTRFSFFIYRVDLI